ncbi:MAG: hypothetical protein N3G22_02005 [Candidatus Micrarchaeota archaeon]|nr:hypothetical protein [Candidatus Micrarchaeota archaeon]
MGGRHTRGQAAMEYLMTYGWAILVIAIALSILVLINPFSPPPGCRFDQVGFSCTQPAFGSNSTDTFVFVTIYNGNNNNIRIFTNSTRCTADKSNAPPTAPPSSSPNITVVRQGNYTITRLRCFRTGDIPLGGQASGTDFSGKLWIFYQNEEDDPSYPVRIASASISGKITR